MGIEIRTIDGTGLTGAAVNVSASGTTALVAAVAGKSIRVYRAVLIATSSVTVQFSDGNTALTGAMTLIAGDPLVLPIDGNPFMATTAGNALNIVLGGAVQVSGSIYYTLVDAIAPQVAALPPWLPAIGGIAPTLYADFTTEATTDHYWYNNATYANEAAWATAVSATMSRASTASYTNSSGNVASAANNVLRFDYDPVALTPKGILLEGSSTNKVTQSQTFSTWTQGNLTSLTTNAATSPSGANDATLIIADATNSFHRLTIVSSLAAGNNTLSAYVKAAGYGFAALRAFDGGTGISIVNFNLTTGAVTSQQDTAPLSLTALPSVQLQNGWWRLSVTANAAFDTVYLYISNSATPTYGAPSSITFAGDTVSGIYVWGAQAEALGFASSYIPTTTTALTRAADAFSLPFVAASTLTAVAKVTAMEAFVSAARVLGVGSGKLINQSDSTHAQTDNGTNNIAAAITSWTTNANKIGVSGTGSARNISANNNAAVTDANALLSGAITTLYLMSDNGSGQSYGGLASIAAWNGTSATAVQLQGLTL